MNKYPTSPAPDTTIDPNLGKDRIASTSEFGYNQTRHVSPLSKRTYVLPYTNLKLVDRNILRKFFLQQDHGITPFLWKHPTEDLTKYPASNQDATLELNDETIGNIAQGFQIPLQAAIHEVQVYLKKIGSPAGNVLLKLQGDSSNKPDGVTLDTSDNVAVTSIGTSLALVTFTFSTPVRLEPFTQYHLVLEGDSAYDTGYSAGVDAVQIGVDASSPSYTDGSISTYATATWTQDTGKCAIFTIEDLLKCQTQDSSFPEERVSNAEGGIYNVTITLTEDI